MPLGSCGDDEGASRVCRAHPGAVSYGSSPESAFLMTNLETENFRSRFTVSREGTRLGEIALNIPGAHNAMNALAVVALATELGIPFVPMDQRS